MRLHGHNPHLRSSFLQYRAHAGNRSAGSNTGYEHINLPVHIAPDFLRGRPFMYFRVGRILELLRNKRIWRFLGQFLGLADRASHAFRGRCQHQFGP
ncbi:hypothetical protein D1872_292490 [compost metagenome]